MSEPDAAAGGAAGAGARPDAPDGRPWTVLGLVRWSTDYLAGKGIDPAEARLASEHLLADTLGASRLQLYIQFERPLTPEELARYKPLLLRRAAREPLQYILGRAAFRELDLAVDPSVLIPRPETEELVEAVLEWTREHPTLTALDVGTGSGCIALSLAREGPFSRVVATDPSPEALETAARNARDTALADRVELRQGSLFESLEPGETFDVVVSNPPYVASVDGGGLEPEVADHEPASALFAGPEGLDVLTPLIEGAPGHLAPGGLFALEVGLGQAPAVADLVRATGAFDEPRIRRDLAGRPRILLAIRRDQADSGTPGRDGGSSTRTTRSPDRSASPKGAKSRWPD